MTIKKGSQGMIQQNLFGAPDNPIKRNKFISTYRVALVQIQFDRQNGRETFS